jgi:hypothetical protein
MEKIWLVVIETEDTETYYYSYKKKPTLKQIKSDFFTEHGHTYPKSEWKMTINPEIKELNIR